MAAAISTQNGPSLPPTETEIPWRKIGDYYELRRKTCQRIYSKKGKSLDLGLFYRDGRFYAMTAWCSHMGGPLYNGEIEDYNGSPHIMCPWHGYMFELSSGNNDIGMQQEVHPVKVVQGELFIQYSSELSLFPFL